MKIFIVISVVLLSKCSEGAISQVLDQCCLTGSTWAGELSQRCDSYPTAVEGVGADDQRACRAILEVCCMKAKQKQQCDRGHKDALEFPSCTTRNVFGAEQYLECCHCCHLGMAHRDMGGDCNYLSDVAFGGPCDRKFRECCIGAVNETVDNDIDECELHPGVLCSHSCVNTLGSYRCECESGYSLHSDARTCIQDDSGINCSLYDPCEHRCVDDTTGVRCQCNSGYQLDVDGVSCQDIDECARGTSNCVGDKRCINTEGGFSCEPITVPVNQCPDGTEYDVASGECQPITTETCDPGYAFNTVTEACDDLDECTVFLHNCYGAYMLCMNTPGSFTCRCDEGFSYNNRSMSCQDIDECAQNINTCQSTQRCENTIGSFRCGRLIGCGTGYTLDSDTQRCVDRDECLLKIHNCGSGYNCVNIQGSFRCVPTQCQFGYRFSSASGRCEPINCQRGLEPNRRGACVDINECERANTCRRTETCKNTYGSYRCRSMLDCQPGHEVDPNTQVCVDIDECGRNLHDCRQNQRCINRPGSYICDCPKGYRVGQEGNCEDINECVDSFVCPFDSVCENSPGSYRCSCNEGLRSEGRRCVDINECEDANTCQYRCLNVYGSFHCQCRNGYQLGADKRSCEDIDECTQFGGRHRLCGGNCVNTPGSYQCECPEGWTSYGRGQSCRDIDECQRPGICGRDNMCFNTKGSYKCPHVVCPSGFVKTMLGPRRNRKPGEVIDTEGIITESRAGRLKAEEGVMCNRRTCNVTDVECRTSKVRSITWQFVALPTVRSLTQPVELLNVQTVSYLLIPNLKFMIIRGNEDGLFEAVTTGNAAALNLVKPVIGPAEYELVLRLENWNILGNQLFSVYLTHVLVDISASELS
ncbi:fibulin-1-like isoform X1 [Mizuhopecten yessoensis]|uniref:fibulin-1-like isoform X1 n=1 Tax=Mizuhopecten yessoensis TaxID=6573 RepID=UPI000B45D809|nr:fibulin-1-like isoform X1 [Mizuhopecten yessoensis]